MLRVFLFLSLALLPLICAVGCKSAGNSEASPDADHRLDQLEQKLGNVIAGGATYALTGNPLPVSRSVVDLAGWAIGIGLSWFGLRTAHERDLIKAKWNAQDKARAERAPPASIAPGTYPRPA